MQSGACGKAINANCTSQRDDRSTLAEPVSLTEIMVVPWTFTRLRFARYRRVHKSDKDMGDLLMRNTIAVAIVAAALPFGAQAQSVPGFYIGAEGGLNWMFNSSFNTNLGIAALGGTAVSATTNASFNTGWAAGGMVGYDFVGPRVELEGLFRQNNGTLSSSLS